MRLRNVRVQGFRRFETEESLNITSKLTAIVGPNEAGKTSLLKSIGYFDSDHKISENDKTSLSTTELKLVLTFFLDKDDLSAAGLNVPSWLDLVKREDGLVKYAIRPLPGRDIRKRRELLALIKKFTKKKSTISVISLDINEPIVLDLSEISNILEITSKYNDAQIAKIAGLLKINMPPIPGAKLDDIQKIAQLARSLLDFEQDHDPHVIAINKLASRVPAILNFTSEYRDITLPYNLMLLDNPDKSIRQKPSKPLAEIVRLSGLDLNQLKRAIDSNNNAIKTGLLADANEKLAELAKVAWKQSDAALYLTVDQYELNVLVRNVKDFELKDQFANFSARSDGYKQFVALQIFTFLKKKSGSILLIDEIEHHLHYDAQADLIQILQNETSIGNVIYTTHSAGALPEDLGVGVRMVKWDDLKKKNSRVVNKFWHHQLADGFKPLLFGMGATTLAFFPTRRALIAEGPTEMLLLPRILREGLGLENLDFQIVHGLSNINPKGLPMIDGGGDGVCYITDSDEAGRSMRDALKTAGVSAKKLFSVSDFGSTLITIEDLLDKRIWLDAVNQYIEMFGRERGLSTALADAPSVGRVSSLPQSIRKEKIAFAYNVIELIQSDPDRQILATAYRAKVKRTGERIRKELGL